MKHTTTPTHRIIVGLLGNVLGASWINHHQSSGLSWNFKCFIVTAWVATSCFLVSGFFPHPVNTKVQLMSLTFRLFTLPEAWRASRAFPLCFLTLSWRTLTCTGNGHMTVSSRCACCSSVKCQSWEITTVCVQFSGRLTICLKKSLPTTKGSPRFSRE